MRRSSLVLSLGRNHGRLPAAAFRFMNCVEQNGSARIRSDGESLLSVTPRLELRGLRWP